MREISQRFHHAVLCLPLLLILATMAPAQQDLQERIYFARDKVFPALVHVQPISEVFERGKKTKQTAVGSGVVVSASGYVITNYHVAGNAVKAICTLANKKRIPATLVGGDPLTDLAVLKLDLSEYEGELAVAEFGESAQLQTGQYVLAMGSPLSLSRSISQGIVSYPERYLGDQMTLDDGEKTGGYHTWIQTTAAINFGNSGGPLVDLDGKIVGINTRTIVGADGLGFSIPSDVVRDIYDQIIETGEVNRSWIGVELQPHSELDFLFGTTGVEGVLVSDVEPRSPAAEAGIQAGDLIQNINGTPVNALFEEEIPPVIRTIAEVPVGSTLEVSVWRQGKVQPVHLLTQEMGKARGEEKEFKAWGLSAQSLTLTKLLELNRTKWNGVLVSGVSGITVKEQTDLVKDDIILEINGEPVTDMEKMTQIYEKSLEEQPEKLVLKTERSRALHFTVLYPIYTLEEEDN
jgi:serine protease Do